MISNKNKEIRITLSKDQAKWLENTCKRAGITKSEYISWMLVKSATELLKVLNQKTLFGDYTDQEIERIIRTPWIK